MNDLMGEDLANELYVGLSHLAAFHKFEPKIVEPGASHQETDWG